MAAYPVCSLWGLTDLPDSSHEGPYELAYQFGSVISPRCQTDLKV
jgi:hypothetical protein